jgi:sialate O-acetylesterase
MSWSRIAPSPIGRGRRRRASTAVCLLGALCLAAPVSLWAQFGGTQPGIAVPPQVKVASPVPSQVFQRDVNGRSAIPIVLDEFEKGATVTEAALAPFGVDASAFVNNQFLNNPLGDRPRFVDGKLVNVPAGGPYAIRVTVKKEGTTRVGMIGPVFVGDLWILAGQSNMEGVGDLVEVTPPNPRVMCLGMDGRWAVAEEPLHWLVDSPDPVHSGDPKARADQSAQQHKTRRKGAGLGLPFAVAMAEQTGIPIGLVACAHGGTSMAQWDPAKKGEGGNSLYGSFLRQAQLAGGKFKGVLWYQGESDAGGEAWKIYPRVFADFIASVRSDLGQQELPFYYVQIGRFVNSSDPKGWNAVQEAQRRLPERVPNTAVVSVIDLELDDLIHVGTQGLKRTGQRLARIALRELFGQVGATTPTLDRVSRGSNNSLILKFKGVNMRLGSGQPARMAAMGAMPGGPGGSMASGPGMGMGGGAMGGLMMASGGASPSLGEPSGLGLRPERHIAGFSIRKEDGTPIPLIFEAAVGKARDTVVLKLVGPIPAKSFLWYGHGLDPYCNLVDGADMAAPVFGPIDLDEVPEFKAPAVAAAGPAPAPAASPRAAASPAPGTRQEPVKLLIITGDHGHDWKATTESLKDILTQGGKIAVDVTTTPNKDLTDANLAKYDVLLLNYKDTPNGAPETRWSDTNKEAFLKAVREGKGLVVFHFASSAFTKPNWEEFEKAIAGGWRSQGYHGPKHVFKVKKTDAKHPISEGLPAEFEHTIDELYQNSKMQPGNVVLATAFSDPNKPRGTNKDEPVIWVGSYGKGRVYNNALGHDVEAMSDPHFHSWMRRGVLWAATGQAE